MIQSRKVKICVLGSAVWLLMACAGAPSNSKPVAPRFYGVWANADLSVHSWVEIEVHRVVSFGVTLSNGRCAATNIDILSKDRVNAPVSSLGNGEMSLKLDGRALLVTGKYGTQRYLPSSRQAICQGPGGTYLPGAPYPK